jgi:hypothetical protein
MTERSPYRLDSGQIEEIVHALQKAAETLRPDPTAELLLRILRILVWVAVAAFVSAVVPWILLPLLPGVRGVIDNILGNVFAAAFTLFIFAALAAILFLLVNLPAVAQALRQRSLLNKLGIREVSVSAWRLQRTRHTWSRLTGAVLTLCSILTIIVGIWVSVFLLTDANKEEMWIALIVVGLLFGVCLAFGVTVLLSSFVQRSREQWAIVADANSLRSTLQSMQAKANAGEAVAIPAAVVEHAAQIERVSIARQRRDAVVAGAGTTHQGYGVLLARDLPSQKGLLDPQHRVAVEELIENLSDNPHPAGVESTADGLLSVRTPEGDVELKYSVDEGTHRVHIVALTAHDHGRHTR